MKVELLPSKTTLSTFSKFMPRPLLTLLFLLLSFLSSLQLISSARQTVTFPISSPSSTYSAFTPITKSIDLWGIPVLSSADVSNADLRHVASILAQYLDNDEDGCPDDRNVVFQLNEVRSHKERSDELGIR